MKINVDPELCMGHGMCTALAPDVYHVDDESGLNEMGTFEVPPALGDVVRRGIAACPERAIQLLDSSDDTPAR